MAAPDQPPQGAAGALLQREALFGRGQRIAGYEFALSGQLRSRAAHSRPAARRVHDELLVNSLARMDLGSLLGSRLAFVDLAPTTIASARVDVLPAINTVLMIDPGTGETVDRFVIDAVLANARTRGYQVGWCLNRPDPALPEALAHCHFVRVDACNFDGMQLSSVVRQLRNPAGAPSTTQRLVASDLATLDDFQHCFRLGFDYFQGSFVERRENWRPPASEVDRGGVMQILNALRGEADGAELASLLQKDPVLTYKFLRYINSAGMSLGATIHSLEQGLLVLGREKFYRWLSLLLFDFKDAGVIERSLTEQALVRARLMERLGSVALPSGPGQDELFLAGLFSLLDQIMGLPLAEVLAKVRVSEPVRAALTGQGGPFAPLLRLVLACEQGDVAQLAASAQELDIDEAMLNRELLDALGWVHEISEALN